ncbi:ABC transporter permease [Coprobacillaceae bacterium CR2/5/TPMF4]|nr:ABC transporter permease [Coprobacillaceae bacterium CR2/5/TPMF4]
MFIHFFKYQLKTLLRNRTVIFWTLVFPIILATFFNLAFSNLTSSENFDAVDVALVEKQENNGFKEILQSLDQDDNKLINLKITNLSDAKELLKDEKISGYYLIDSSIELIVNDSGINETILESIINEYLSLQSTINNIGSINPDIIYNNILNQLDLNQNHFKQIDIGKNTDSTVIYFYTLIGMNCLNASFVDFELIAKLRLIYQDREQELIFHRFLN